MKKTDGYQRYWLAVLGKGTPAEVVVEHGLGPEGLGAWLHEAEAIAEGAGQIERPAAWCDYHEQALKALLAATLPLHVWWDDSVPEDAGWSYRYGNESGAVHDLEGLAKLIKEAEKAGHPIDMDRWPEGGVEFDDASTPEEVAQGYQVLAWDTKHVMLADAPGWLHERMPDA